MRRIDALEYARGIKEFKNELISAGANLEDGIYITEVDVYFSEKIAL